MTRKVANWFHERDGELFTVDETPFTRDEIVQVVNDSVDPIQQVMVEGEKYVGVIQYDEHDGWYEYTRWDDSVGEVTMGVCAKCVEDAEYVDEVSRTVGDSTDVAREKFEHHYEEDHEVCPDEVNTGATLLSGTTINGNEAIHPGMDGHGSGVDADFVLGNEALQTGSFYSFDSTTAGKVNKSFKTPSFLPFGIGIDTAGSIWHTNSSGSYPRIIKTDRTGSVESNFTSPCIGPTGISVDSNGSLWHADDYSNCIFKLTESGTAQTKFTSPDDSPAALDLDESGCIWHSDKSSIYKIKQNGDEIFGDGFATPSIGTNGVSIGLNGCIWHGQGNFDSIYKSNRSGTIETGFAMPSDSHGGIKIDDNGCMWHCGQDSNNDGTIYKVEKETKIIFK